MGAKPGRKMSEPTHEEVMEFVRRHKKPFVKTPDVAEAFDGPDGPCDRTLRNRLNDLVDRGELEKTWVGAGAVVWWEEPQNSSDSASRSLPASESQ